uniref:Uncharacterized protein n=1 Tax=Syphacia muris TaxID=451379 RepID=A0A0N5AW67_9BILA
MLKAADISRDFEQNFAKELKLINEEASCTTNAETAFKLIDIGDNDDNDGGVGGGERQLRQWRRRYSLTHIERTAAKFT